MTLLKRLHWTIWLLYFLLRYIHSQPDGIYVQNLDDFCMRCLCYAATNCDLGKGCSGDHCGAYNISKSYWLEAGSPTLADDDPRRSGAFEDCAITYECAQRAVRNYLAKNAKDCDGNGVTNCDDYVQMNYNGGVECNEFLDANWTTRYQRCAPT